MDDRNRVKVMLDKGAYIPERAHEQDAGLDLRSPIKLSIYAGESAIIDTGVHVAIPDGYVGMLKSKSGLNVKYGLLNEGVIDAGYTGSIIVKLYNFGDRDIMVERGDKVSQLVILPIITPDVEMVNNLDKTERGSNGFGSTGR
jgi:dUTP pyrophosphatase